MFARSRAFTTKTAETALGPAWFYGAQRTAKEKTPTDDTGEGKGKIAK